jgi:hypothetical protein
MRTNTKMSFINVSLILLILVIISEARIIRSAFESGHLSKAKNLMHKTNSFFGQENASLRESGNDIDMVKDMWHKLELVPKRRRLRTDVFRRLFVG